MHAMLEYIRWIPLYTHLNRTCSLSHSYSLRSLRLSRIKHAPSEVSILYLIHIVAVLIVHLLRSLLVCLFSIQPTSRFSTVFDTAIEVFSSRVVHEPVVTDAADAGVKPCSIACVAADVDAVSVIGVGIIIESEW